MMHRLRTPHSILSAAVFVAAAALVPHAQTSPSARVTKIAGDKHHLALMSDGHVTGWGQFRSGQLGPYDTINAPGQYSLAPIPQELPGNAIDVAAGDSTSYVVLEDGSVWAWGRGDYGQLGIGAVPPLPLLPSPEPSYQYRGADRPRRVPLPPAVAVGAAGDAAYVVLRDGTVSVWGNIRLSNSPKEGFTNSPVPVAGVADVASISAGQTHTLVVTKERTRLWMGIEFLGRTRARLDGGHLVRLRCGRRRSDRCRGRDGGDERLDRVEEGRHCGRLGHEPGRAFRQRHSHVASHAGRASHARARARHRECQGNRFGRAAHSGASASSVRASPGPISRSRSRRRLRAWRRSSRSVTTRSS